MPDVNDHDEYVRWILESTSMDDLIHFLRSEGVMAIAKEHFWSDWKDYCAAHPDEPPLPYETAVYSEPQVNFEDVHGDETGDYMDLLPGTLVEVIRKDSLFPDLRLCRIANGDPNQYFWLDIEEIQYEEE